MGEKAKVDERRLYTVAFFVDRSADRVADHGDFKSLFEQVEEMGLDAQVGGRASLRNSSKSSGRSCSAACGSPCSICDKIWVTSDMAIRIASDQRPRGWLSARVRRRLQ